ncbi:hypothetical protein DL98DRAFT_579443 [Cadophora sp. DSE1049]|nr:hypothetical protein DL98DRAFT_579443 [Cadophora sp. DSE1049]
MSLPYKLQFAVLLGTIYASLAASQTSTDTYTESGFLLTKPSKDSDITSETDTFLDTPQPETFISVGPLLGIVVAAFAALLVIISFYVIYRQVREERRDRRRKVSEKDEEARRVEQQEGERMPELWCRDRIPVETDGRGVWYVELEGRSVMNEVEGIGRGVELEGDDVGVELDADGSGDRDELKGKEGRTMYGVREMKKISRKEITHTNGKR